MGQVLSTSHAVDIAVSEAELASSTLAGDDAFTEKPTKLAGLATSGYVNLRSSQVPWQASQDDLFEGLQLILAQQNQVLIEHSEATTQLAVACQAVTHELKELKLSRPQASNVQLDTAGAHPPSMDSQLFAVIEDLQFIKSALGQLATDQQPSMSLQYSAMIENLQYIKSVVGQLARGQDTAQTNADIPDATAVEQPITAHLLTSSPVHTGWDAGIDPRDMTLDMSHGVLSSQLIRDPSHGLQSILSLQDRRNSDYRDSQPRVSRHYSISSDDGSIFQEVEHKSSTSLSTSSMPIRESVARPMPRSYIDDYPYVPSSQAAPIQRRTRPGAFLPRRTYGRRRKPTRRALQTHMNTQMSDAESVKLQSPSTEDLYGKRGAHMEKQDSRKG